MHSTNWTDQAGDRTNINGRCPKVQLHPQILETQQRPLYGDTASFSKCTDKDEQTLPRDAAASSKFR